MNQEERRKYLIEILLSEQNQKISIPKDQHSQKILLRGLMNIRTPRKTSDIFMVVMHLSSLLIGKCTFLSKQIRNCI